MCGFAGFIDFQSQSPEHQIYHLKILAQMGEQLSRRGLDDEQYYHVYPLSFAFKHLSIVDADAGQQPIWNEDSSIFVAVNGKIYNHLDLRSRLKKQHEFRTNSDAEIILHLYEEIGIEALHLLNGMFAITLWDTRKQQLFLARDRLGIKPLYYTKVNSKLIFGSTLMSVLAHPQAPRNPQFQDLTNLSLTHTYIKQINRLAGGHYLLYDANTNILEPQCYWNLEDYLAVDERSDSRQPQDYIREYRDLFADSVKKRLMSDVPMGGLLSGGLDSGAVVAAAKQFQEPIHCFGIFTDYTLGNEDTKAAYQLSKRLNFPFSSVDFNMETMLEEMDFSLDTLEYFVWLMDSPRFNLEWFFKHELYRYAKTVMPDLKMMLLGQGADEFAGGYSDSSDRPNHNWDMYIDNLDKTQQQRIQFKQSNKLEDESSLVDLTLKSYPAGCTTFQKEMLYRIYTLQQSNLWHEDRTSMSQNIEAHIPFLDHRLVEYLAAIPPAHHPSLFWNKTIIREMTGDWLSVDFRYRQKSYILPPHQYQIIYYQIIQRVFPDFRDKYLTEPQPLFGREKLNDWFEQTNFINSNGIDLLYNIGTGASAKLLNAMNMVIFKDICRNVATPVGNYGSYLYSDSPYRANNISC